MTPHARSVRQPALLATIAAACVSLVTATGTAAAAPQPRPPRPFGPPAHAQVRDDVRRGDTDGRRADTDVRRGNADNRHGDFDNRRPSARRGYRDRHEDGWDDDRDDRGWSQGAGDIWRHRHPDFVCNLHPDGNCLPSCSYIHRGPYSQRQYDKGYDAGAQEGWDAGYYDGECGRRYFARPDYRVRRLSAHFVNGFIDGFADAYAKGYRQGELRYARRHPLWRPDDCCH